MFLGNVKGEGKRITLVIKGFHFEVGLVTLLHISGTKASCTAMHNFKRVGKWNYTMCLGGESDMSTNSTNDLYSYSVITFFFLHFFLQFYIYPFSLLSYC